MATIETAGYVIVDNEGLILGSGATVDAAWEIVRECEVNGDHLNEAALRVWPATAELLADVEKRGGNIAWDRVAGVACSAL